VCTTADEVLPGTHEKRYQQLTHRWQKL